VKPSFSLLPKRLAVADELLARQIDAFTVVGDDAADHLGALAVALQNGPYRVTILLGGENAKPGLAFRTQAGDWIDVPTVPDAFIVNGGQLLLRWTNDRFLATPHRAVNRTGGERYALAFFCDAQIDWPIAAVPTCVGPGHPPRYETTYYTDYMIRYQARTYNVFDDQAKDAAE